MGFTSLCLKWWNGGHSDAESVQVACVHRHVGSAARRGRAKDERADFETRVIRGCGAGVEGRAGTSVAR